MGDGELVVNTMQKWQIRELFQFGSSKSGHYGHKGIPGHRGGSVSGSGPTFGFWVATDMVDETYLTKGPGKDLFEEDALGEDIEAFGSAMMEAKITVGDLSGINYFTTKAPPGFEDKGAHFEDDRGYGLLGRYDRVGKIVYAHTYAAGTSTTVHEIGHHVAQRNLGPIIMTRKVSGQSVFALDSALKTYKRSLTVEDMAKAGLRQYSFSRIGEFMADAFKVRKLGTPEQNQKVKEVADFLKVDLEEAFK